jgi:hypothetical protein
MTRSGVVGVASGALALLAVLVSFVRAFSDVAADGGPVMRGSALAVVLGLAAVVAGLAARGSESRLAGWALGLAGMTAVALAALWALAA